MNRDIVLDLYIFDKNGKFVYTLSAEAGVINNKATTPILILEQNRHPFEQISEYLTSIGLIKKQIELMPCVYLNKFDTEKDKDYLVLSFKVLVDDTKTLNNNDLMVTTIDDYKNLENLLPEFKKKYFIDALNGKQIFYRGFYKDSDSSYDVLDFTLLN